MTIILDAYQDEDLSTAADLLQAGKLVAVPTETVYGLAAPSANPHKMLSPTSATQVLTTMGDKLDAVSFLMFVWIG